MLSLARSVGQSGVTSMNSTATDDPASTWQEPIIYTCGALSIAGDVALSAAVLLEYKYGKWSLPVEQLAWFAVFDIMNVIANMVGEVAIGMACKITAFFLWWGYWSSCFWLAAYAHALHHIFMGWTAVAPWRRERCAYHVLSWCVTPVIFAALIASGEIKGHSDLYNVCGGADLRLGFYLNIPVLIVMAMNGTSFIMVHRHVSRQRRLSATLLGISEADFADLNKRATLWPRFAAYIGVFVATQLPYTVLNLLEGVLHVRVPDPLGAVVTANASLHGLFNFFVYGLSQPWFCGWWRWRMPALPARGSSLASPSERGWQSMQLPSGKSMSAARLRSAEAPVELDAAEEASDGSGAKSKVRWREDTPRWTAHGTADDVSREV